MLTVAKPLLLRKQWPSQYCEIERAELASHVAGLPDAVDAVPESGGIR